ncbi:MAG: hypothetical protein ACTSWC_09970 [Promethearchaeota archaeon]
MNETTTNILLSVLLGVLLILFIWKSIITKHYIPYFLFAFVSLFIGASIFLILQTALPSIPRKGLIALELMFFGLSLFFLYLFLESLRTLTINLPLFLIIFTLLIIQQVSLLFVLFTLSSENSTELNWFFADISYNSMGAIINLGIGFPFYFRNFKRTRSKSSIFLVVAFSILTFGYLSLLVADIAWYFSVFSFFQDIIFKIGNVLPIIGLIMILLVYIADIHYFYQIPSNLFVVMLSDPQGNIIFQSKYENIYAKLPPLKVPITQLLNSINQIFINNFESNSSVKLIKSEDVSIIRTVGKYYSAVVVSNSISKMLEHALIRFLDSFENKFGNNPPEFFQQSNVVEEIVALLIASFPFLEPTYQNNTKKNGSNK